MNAQIKVAKIRRKKSIEVEGPGEQKPWADIVGKGEVGAAPCLKWTLKRKKTQL